ncbi:hypothetical protein BC834DRAFT_94484 [Gloeopeniophorella convolvens]|nr:hypothetical protein BC834DRAFT_94484 [Gloeopeniophorella convolvens]
MLSQEAHKRLEVPLGLPHSSGYYASFIIFFVLAAAGQPVVVGALSGPVRQTNFAKAAHCYLDALADVSKDTLLHKLRGSEIGAAPGVVLPFLPVLMTWRNLCSSCAMAASYTTRILTTSPSSATLRIPYGPFWTTQCSHSSARSISRALQATSLPAGCRRRYSTTAWTGSPKSGNASDLPRRMDRHSAQLS